MYPLHFLVSCPPLFQACTLMCVHALVWTYKPSFMGFGHWFNCLFYRCVCLYDTYVCKGVFAYCIFDTYVFTGVFVYMIHVIKLLSPTFSFMEMHMSVPLKSCDSLFTTIYSNAMLWNVHKTSSVLQVLYVCVISVYCLNNRHSYLKATTMRVKCVLLTT